MATSWVTSRHMSYVNCFMTPLIVAGGEHYVDRLSVSQSGVRLAVVQLTVAGGEHYVDRLSVCQSGVRLAVVR